MRLRACTALFASLICAVILCACQGSSSLEQQQGTALSPESAQEPGAGVDPALWAKLTAELNRVLEQEGTAKRTSAGPIGKGSQVQNLSVRSNGPGVRWEWNYRNQGDYDLNGVVNISDLTMVGLHFNKDTLSPDWQQAQLADGDGNGVVNIGDVTPIGQNFGGQVDGYEFQSRPGGPATNYATLEDYPFVAGDKTTGLYPSYVRDTLPSLAGPTYRVVPYVDSGGGREYGVPSNEYVTGITSRSNWFTFHSNNFRTDLARADGPADVGETWETELEGRLLFQEPIVDYMGSIYIGTGLETTMSDFNSPGFFYSLDQDGNIRWRFKTAGIVAMTAATNRKGEIVFGDSAGIVYCLTRDGKQLWRRQLSGLIVYTGALLDDEGNAFLTSHTLTGGSIASSTLYRLSPDGTVAWSRPTSDTDFVAPFYNNINGICTVDQSGDMYEFDYDGNSQYNFMLPSPPAGNLFAYSLVSQTTAVLYADQLDNLRVHFFNNSGTFAFPLGDEPVTAPAINTSDKIIIATRTAAPDQVIKLNYYDGITKVWDMELGGDFVSAIAVDLSDRMYFSTFLSDDTLPTNNNGVSCVLPDQTILWFYPTGSKLAFSPVVADENLVVCGLITSLSSDPGNSYLLGIRGS